jgi:hypothetical protein
VSKTIDSTCDYIYVDTWYDEDGDDTYTEYDRCDDDAVGLFDGVYYCEWHAARQESVK